MANRPNIAGGRFGRLVAVGVSPQKRGPRRLWYCKCDCGNAHQATTTDLTSGNVASCGCLFRGPTARNARHGHAMRSGERSLTYNSWRGMHDRCTNPNHVRFDGYGGRGIRVCDDWSDFATFLADMGERPAGMSLDRINVDGHYEPANCRWATAIEQRHNQRREAA